MADCTKAVEYIREMKRMCDNVVVCEICPLRGVAVEDDCMSRISKNPAKAIDVVQKWSDEHPVMTWKGKLRELLPNVDMGKIIGTCCPYNLLGGEAPNMDTCRCSGDYGDCVNCWNSGYKEAEK